MGLSISVGVLDPRSGFEGAWQETIKGELKRLVRFMTIAGLKPHLEPSTLGLHEPCSFEMWGYTGLQNLRRLAAHLWSGRDLPAPVKSKERASDDVLLKNYYAKCDWTVEDSGVRRFRAPAKGRHFDHLVFHSDSDGFYFPQDFEEVLVTYEDGQEYSEAVGSSFALRREVEMLAGCIELPLNLDPESDEVWDVADSPPSEGPLWKRYGVEAFTCLRLYQACRRSIESNSVLVFH